jgi:DNA-binding transcriptional MerR regulator
MADRSHLSIGEVLSLLQGEFPDVTISKIRFLESQGLLDPERTPSGYRKFYEADIERLRWILHQQRDNFLPLKVIKDRLDEADRDGLVVPAEPEHPEAPAPVDAPEPAMAPATPAVAPTAREAEPEPEPAPAPRAAEPERSPAPAPAPPRTQPAASPLDAGPSSVSLTLDELASACGLARDELVELERFGLLSGHPVGADTYYDGDALVIARTAAGFLRYGIEARHLRMYKVAAEREAGFFEQVVMPLLKQRNPTARQQAADTLGDLSTLGESLRAALLRAALGEHR